ncbi:acyl-CoA thioesterase [Bacillus sp. ISL-47]|uniref:acyl-CoA thioesterase n=1 Tax=Bacillus sp. ISL-47 TaxID=2819130 RepID=UPI001BEBD28D|nr:thioesterase family protein [Bacillus sp. ISL-47]MBT2688137.1 acyl-CoA thioesterase [Bacillus sp. ISL-47]MBT2707605.1 acyl-CoA thioesterase [Pseudomonas sp. ISL-84]
MGKLNYIDDFKTWEEEFIFFHPVKVRFSETDMFGHLNNTVPFTYYEEARIEFFKSKGFMQDWVKPDNETIPVVADLQCDFLSQVFFDEEIKIYVKAAAIGNSSVDLHYMGKKPDGSICFAGRGTMVQISKKNGKGVPWTEEMKELLKSGVKVRA